MANLLIMPRRQDNRFPHLSYLRLIVEQDDLRALAIGGILRFSEHDEASVLGVLRLRLKRASIHVEISGGDFNVDQLEFGSRICLVGSDVTNVSYELLDERGEDAAQAVSGGASGSGVSGKFDIGSSDYRKTSIGKSFGTSEPPFICNVGGGEKSIYITIECNIEKKFIQGEVSPRIWFRAAPDCPLTRLSGRVVVRPADIDFEGVGGMWPENLPKGKLNLIRILAFRVVDIRDYLSLSEFEVFRRSDADSSVGVDESGGDPADGAIDDT